MRALSKCSSRPLLAAHELLRRTDGEARRVALDQHRADAADAAVVAHVHQEHRGVRAEGREHLGAVEDVVRAIGLRCGLEVGHCRAGVGLAHAEADHHAACEAFGQPLLLLIIGAVFRKRSDRPEIAELHHIGAARADRRDLLDRDHRIHQRAALAAVGLRDGDAHQALFAHLLRHREREARVVGAGQRVLDPDAPARSGAQIRRTGSALR